VEKDLFEGPHRFDLAVENEGWRYSPERIIVTVLEPLRELEREQHYRELRRLKKRPRT
jgi:hypothetical protein